MGVYIKGMEMPTDRSRWVVIYPDGKVDYSDKTDEWETLDKGAVPVPPHGDLIDYNFCIENYELLHDDDGNPVYAVRMRDINNAPTIVPAEEGEI